MDKPESEMPRIRVVKRNMPQDGSSAKKAPGKLLGLPIWAVIAIVAGAYCFYSNGSKTETGSGEGPVPRQTPQERPQPLPKPVPMPQEPSPVQMPQAPSQRPKPARICSTCGGKQLVRVSCPCPSCSELSLNNVVLTKHGGMCGFCGGQGGAVAPNGAAVICPKCGGLGFAVCDKCSGAGEVLARCPSCAGAQPSSMYASSKKEDAVSCRVAEKLKNKEEKK